jgi:hypothetical protein
MADCSDEWRDRAGACEAKKNQIEEQFVRMEKMQDQSMQAARQARNEANSAIWELQALQRTHAETTALLEARTMELTGTLPSPV